MIKSLFETHINVRDVETSAEFYENVLKLQVLLDDKDRKSKFYWVGPDKSAMFGIRENYPSTFIQRQHFAFRVDLLDLFKAINYLTEKNIEVTNFYGGNPTDLYVFAYMPAVSIYFDDPDGHTVELISLLNEEPIPELGIISFARWKELKGEPNS